MQGCLGFWEAAAEQPYLLLASSDKERQDEAGHVFKASNIMCTTPIPAQK